MRKTAVELIRRQICIDCFDGLCGTEATADRQTQAHKASKRVWGWGGVDMFHVLDQVIGDKVASLCEDVVVSGDTDTSMAQQQ